MNANLTDLAGNIAKLFQNAATHSFYCNLQRDTASILAAAVESADFTVVEFKSKKQGNVGNFLVKDLNKGEVESAAITMLQQLVHLALVIFLYLAG
ncbi:MAG: hypothetical protein MTP17_01450 [Candidatus Midichloria sp.]|nr:MAG: hypothetical protein MTP17_01450 [Candidatus Midichloria sp.]